MNAWRAIVREVVGAWRSLRYDLGRLGPDTTADLADPDADDTDPAWYPARGAHARPPRRVRAAATVAALVVLSTTGSYLGVLAGLSVLMGGAPAADLRALPGAGSGGHIPAPTPGTAGTPRRPPGVGGGAAATAASPEVSVPAPVPTPRRTPGPAPRPPWPTPSCPAGTCGATTPPGPIPAPTTAVPVDPTSSPAPTRPAPSASSGSPPATPTPETTRAPAPTTSATATGPPVGGAGG